MLPPAAFRVVVQALPAAAGLRLGEGGRCGRPPIGSIQGSVRAKAPGGHQSAQSGVERAAAGLGPVQARVQYGAQIGGQRVPGIGRGAVELGEGGVGLPVAHVAHHAGQHVLNGAAQGLQRQKLRIANAHAPMRAHAGAVQAVQRVRVGAAQALGGCQGGQGGCCVRKADVL